MIEKYTAAQAYAHALKAVAELSAALKALHGKCSQEEYAQIKKAVGMSIGKIQTDILDMLNSAHPELDDLPR